MPRRKKKYVEYEWGGDLVQRIYEATDIEKILGMPSGKITWRRRKPKKKK